MKIVETSHCGVSMCFIACRGFRNPPGPLKRGRRKATQDLGPVGSRPVGWQPAGVPLLRGSGVSETICQTVQGPVGVFKNPLAPLKGGWRKAAQDLGPVGPCPAGVPLLRGSGVSETICQTVQGPVGVFKNPLTPLKGGWRKAAQEFGSGRLASGRLAAGRCPPPPLEGAGGVKRGSGVSKP